MRINLLCLNVKMPTPDASQYTEKMRYQSIQDRKITGGKKLITHLYSYVPPVTMLRDFTPSFTNKTFRGLSFIKLHISTGK